MVGEAESHGGGAAQRAAPPVGDGERLAERRVRAEPVAFEGGQTDGGIPRRPVFGEGMRLAGEAGEPVAQHAIEAFDVDGVRLGDRWPDRRADIDSRSGGARGGV